MARSLLKVAHRGGSLLAPENTLAAFRNALTLPVDVIEFDVQMSSDGHPFVFHDATVDRLTDGTGNLLDLDSAYLRTLNAAAHFPGGWPLVERIPTLQDVLQLVRGRVRLFIELKLAMRSGAYQRYAGIGDAVIRALRSAKMIDRAVLISFDWDLLRLLRYIEPMVTTGAIVARDQWLPDDDSAPDHLCRRLTELGCNWIALDQQLFVPSMLPAFHHNGFKVGLWTVNELEALQDFASTGVDSLTSDRPDLFSQL